MPIIPVNLDDYPLYAPHEFITIDPHRQECIHCNAPRLGGVVGPAARAIPSFPQITYYTPSPEPPDRCKDAEYHWGQEGSPYKSRFERSWWEECCFILPED